MWCGPRRSASRGRSIGKLTQADPAWRPETAKAFLNRLVKKQALAFSKPGRAGLYRPPAQHEECVHAALHNSQPESDTFMPRVRVPTCS